MSILKEFQWSFKEVERVFQECFKVFSRNLLFHESLESVRKIEECFEGVSREFQWY